MKRLYGFYDKKSHTVRLVKDGTNVSEVSELYHVMVGLGQEPVPVQVAEITFD